VNQDPSTNGKNTDVTVGQYDSTKNYVDFQGYTDDTKAELIISIDAAGQTIAVSPDATSFDFMLVRGVQTTKNNDPGRYQEFKVHFATNASADYVQLRFEEPYSAVKDKNDYYKNKYADEFSWQPGTPYLNAITIASADASKDVAVYWQGCCPVECSDVYKTTVYVDVLSNDATTVLSSDVVSFDLFVGILDCGIEKAWQFLPSTYDPYATFAHRADMIIWGTKSYLDWAQWGTHVLDLGPFVVEKFVHPDTKEEYNRDWVVESIWNRTTYYMQADNGEYADGLPYHGWFLVREGTAALNTGYKYRLLREADMDYFPYDSVKEYDLVTGDAGAQSMAFQYLYGNTRTDKTSGNTLPWSKKIDRPAFRVNESDTVPHFTTATHQVSKDIAPKLAVYFGVPASDFLDSDGKSQPVHMIYKAWKPADNIEDGGWIASADWEQVSPNFCQETKMQPQIWYDSVCLESNIVSDPCQNKHFTFYGKTLSDPVYEDVATTLGVEVADMMDICEEGCKPSSTTECIIGLTPPCNNVIFKEGEITVNFTDTHPDKTVITPFRVATIFTKGEIEAKSAATAAAITEAFDTLPAIDAGPVNKLFEILTIAKFSDRAGTVVTDLVEKAKAAGTAMGINNFFRLFPMEDKSYSVKDAWVAGKTLELSFYVVLVDGPAPAGSESVIAQNGYFVIYDGVADRTFVDPFALMTKCASEPTVTPTPAEGVAYTGLVDGYTVDALSDEEKAAAEEKLPEGKVCSSTLAAAAVAGDLEDGATGATIEVTAYSEYSVVAQKTDGTWEALALPTASDFALAAVDEYEIADGGDYDLSDEAGKVEFKVAVCKLAEAPTPTTGGDGGSSGCNAGFAPLALLLLAPLAVLLKK
jgi:Synergist-CTERM protein sorting domain-containing protein